MFPGHALQKIIKFLKIMYRMAHGMIMVQTDINNILTLYV